MILTSQWSDKSRRVVFPVVEWNRKKINVY